MRGRFFQLHGAGRPSDESMQERALTYNIFYVCLFLCLFLLHLCFCVCFINNNKNEILLTCKFYVGMARVNFTRSAYKAALELSQNGWDAFRNSPEYSRGPYVPTHSSKGPHTYLECFTREFPHPNLAIRASSSSSSSSSDPLSPYWDLTKR